ncbi:MAG: coproporphyrinogen III oxidase [Notoacmeibacter sp.]|nr:coproporphyrinogen III oxidase [Notoacmeibacter sp.]MCC0032415.1 coproporphyrinogen III oxidase [Brucellaceae bacterium]
MSINRDDGSPGFGIYLHWPFCAAKCPYCDFNSHVRHQPVDQPRFAAAFTRELEAMRRLSGPRQVTSVFVGGGTPSLMEPATIAAILETVARLWHVPDGIEITMEANPQSADAGRFRGYRAAGVNRLSLGVQALNDRDLKFLGRLHDAGEAMAAIRLARETFPRLSFDLIYGRPGQTVDLWERELEEAIALAADHLSAYQLTIEEGTPFHALWKAGKIATPDPDLGADLYERTQDVTGCHGLPAYEVSNHAVPGAESRHNLTYWRYGEYVGVGPGAHGRLAQDDKRLVMMAARHPETWLERVESGAGGTEETELLDHASQADEMLLMGLRLVEGLDVTRLERVRGTPLDAGRLATLQREGLIEPVGNTRIRATRSGMIVLDALIGELARTG